MPYFVEKCWIDITFNFFLGFSCPFHLLHQDGVTRDFSYCWLQFLRYLPLCFYYVLLQLSSLYLSTLSLLWPLRWVLTLNINLLIIFPQMFIISLIINHNLSKIWNFLYYINWIYWTIELFENNLRNFMLFYFFFNIVISRIIDVLK